MRLPVNGKRRARHDMGRVARTHTNTCWVTPSRRGPLNACRLFSALVVRCVPEAWSCAVGANGFDL